jgi:hypothetical protein
MAPASRRASLLKHLLLMKALDVFEASIDHGSAAEESAWHLIQLSLLAAESNLQRRAEVAE